MKVRPPLFYERDAYRRRRLMDAARVLPFVGVVLVLLPLLWSPQSTPAPDTARGGVYLFAIWGALIVGTFILARGLSRIAVGRDDKAGRLDGDGDRG
jgi:hypothetical protein